METEIRIDGVIGKGEGEISSSMIIAQLPTDNSDIHVRLHSEGGDVFEGFRIHDAFENYPGRKRITVESSAFSIASFIPMAFEDIEITPNGYMMLHPPRLNMDDATSSDLDQKSVLLKQLEQNMYQAYAKRTGKSVDEIKTICEQETFLDASTCVGIGLANRVTQKPFVGRVFARTKNMPQGVISALFGADSSGNNSQPKEKPMSESTRVAASLKQIKAAFPKAKNDFVVRCMEKEMTMEEVGATAMEEMVTENETLSAKVKAMEDELAALKAQAMAPVEEEPALAVTARSGVTPVVKAKTGSVIVNAKAQWHQEINKRVDLGKSRGDAILEVDRQCPGLRDSMIAEANSR